MADQSHLDILAQGVEAWNSWRRELYPSVKPDLSGANLSGADLSEADLRDANLTRANLWDAILTGAVLDKANLHDAYLENADLREASLYKTDLGRAGLPYADLRNAYLYDASLYDANVSAADLSGAELSEAHLGGSLFNFSHFIEANLSGADLSGANLYDTNLTEANLSYADLSGTNLTKANLTEADLRDANLTHSVLVKTNLTGTTLTGCSIYGISAWDLKLERTIQQNLNVSDEDEPAIMVDNLEVAQFIYLLLNNEKIRDVIDTIGEKGVLILGRFTEERKAVLEAIRDRLRNLGFVPMMFDFARPTQRDFSETIKTLAGLSRFIIADITNPKSSPLELQATMPDYMIPFVPIIHEDEEPFAMFRDLRQKYGEWVLDVRKYDSAANLQKHLEKAVVRPALDKSDQLILKKAEAIRTRHINEYQ
jgi:uncharacterized protein YjbI with pentapeptide repeats